MVKMTPRDALLRQEEHIKHYGQFYPASEEALRTLVQSRTDVEGLDLDKEYCIGSVINGRIPRGGDIEYIVFGKDQGGN